MGGDEVLETGDGEMKDVSWYELAVIAAIVAILMIVIFGGPRQDFEKACNAVGGNVVWDGRQYQCLK